MKRMHCLGLLVGLLGMVGCKPGPAANSAATESFTIPTELFGEKETKATKSEPEPPLLQEGWWVGALSNLRQTTDKKSLAYDVEVAIHIVGKELTIDEMLVNLNEPRHHDPNDKRSFSEKLRQEMQKPTRQVRSAPDILIRYSAKDMHKQGERFIARNGRYALGWTNVPEHWAALGEGETRQQKEQRRTRLPFYNPVSKRIDPIEVEVQWVKGQLEVELFALDPTTQERRQGSLASVARLVQPDRLEANVPKRLADAFAGKANEPIPLIWQDVLPEEP